MSKTTNKQQHNKLYEALSRKPDIAKGYTKRTKEEINLFWEELKTDLNLLGPPIKDAGTWRKVWLDWKAYVKRKLTENQLEHNATGGGSYKKHSFSMLEEGVIQLTGLQISTAGIRGTISYGVTNQKAVSYSESSIIENKEPSPQRIESPIDVSMTSERESYLHSQPSTSNKAQVSNVHALLERQINMQKEFYENTQKYYESQQKATDELLLSTKKIYRGIDKLCDLGKNYITIMKTHTSIKEKLLKQKVKIKAQILEIKKSKYGFQNNQDSESD
ncbi:uncharacterized protein LOC129946485 [Eupeodes corollae]|uniref:uncharacterized protein LOC129946485 n=1 Tax=Eupeodes corollae TaxID=290404 RepID=UPI00248FA7D9|nr:uncharacterized protein LOC129946485 [Eupeodes corollae]